MALETAERLERLAEALPDEPGTNFVGEAQAARTLYNRLYHDLDPDGFHLLVQIFPDTGRAWGENRTWWMVKTKRSDHPDTLLLDVTPEVFRKHKQDLVVQARDRSGEVEVKNETANEVAHNMRRRFNLHDDDLMVYAGSETVSLVMSVEAFDEFASVWLRT
jgi:hypothetical protein